MQYTGTNGLTVNSTGGSILAAVRKDSAASLVASDTDWSPLQVTSTGELRVNIGSSSISAITSFSNYAVSEIGTTAVQLTAVSSTITQGVQLKAANSNSGSIYIGSLSGVTNGSIDATDGFELAAGESLFVPIDDPSKIYVIGSATGKKVFVVVI